MDHVGMVALIVMGCHVHEFTPFRNDVGNWTFTKMHF